MFCQVLGCRRDASRAELRAAYYERMKLLHPDMNMDADTTVDAVILNAAYLEVTQVRLLGSEILVCNH